MARHSRQPRRERAWVLSGAVCLWLAVAGGCGGPSGRASAHAAIQSENPSERIKAIRAAGQGRDRQAVPLLVDRLEDEDDAVRFFAILALEKITGERFGYDYAQAASERAKSVERWRAYSREGGDAAAREAAMSGRSAPGGSGEGASAPADGEAR